MKMFNKMKLKYGIYIITIYISILYFSFKAIQGSNFSNEMQTDNYIAITLLVDVIAIFIALKSLRGKKNKNMYFPILLPLFLIALYFLEEGGRSWMFNSFLAFSIPCCYIGTSMGVERSLKELSVYLEPIMLFVTLAIGITLPYMLFARTIDFEYQTFSYYCSFAYTINLFFILFGKEFNRLKLFDNIIYTVLSVFLLVIQASCCLIAGGRGGFIVIIFSTLVFLLLMKKKIIGPISVFIVLFVLILNLLPSDMVDSMTMGSERTFSFLQGGKLDMSSTSGRDVVYDKAVVLIENRPLLGYGIFGYAGFNKSTPHNIFLEVMLQGGIFYSIIFWMFMLSIIIKLRKMIKLDNRNMLLVAMGIWPGIELLFSGSYMMFGLFWFLVSYIFVYNTKSKFKVNYENLSCNNDTFKN